MTLRRLEIDNLKCFVSLRLALAPLTLLTGFNSAGKSTALQAILLLAQGFRLSSREPHIPLNGPLVRLGSAGDVLSSSSKGREINIGVESDHEGISFEFHPMRLKSNALEVGGVKFRGRDGKEQTWSKALWLAKPATLASEILDSLVNVVCISAVRGGAMDAFPIPDDPGVILADVGSEGQYSPWWYSERADDEIDIKRCHPADKAASLRRQIDAYLNDLFPGAQASADEIARTSLVRLGLRQGTTSDWRRPANMGYGLTYAFPVLVSLLLAKPGQVLVIDSPEAHLHPRAQSRMGQMLARFAAAGVQVLLESHSDHVLNGVRLAVRQHLISSGDVAVHFFSGFREDSVHQVISPQIDKEGTLDSWPDGFFDQAEGDLAVLAGWK